MSILVTGGAGYIGSHTVVQLLARGEDVVILDNLSNSKADVVDRIGRIVGRLPKLILGDIRDPSILSTIFREHDISAVFHFAGLKSVSESESYPLRYYDNNVHGSIILLEGMRKANVKQIIFSSSATVYGLNGSRKYSEASPLNPINVYGRSKLAVENILADLKESDPSWRIAILRYFNPVGAHASGLIGEEPLGIPNNLMPFILQVASALRDRLYVFGADYDTPDGTGQRDYIHVDDLASGHLAALDKLSSSPETLVLNLGTGKPSSVLEVVAAFERQSGKRVTVEIAPRRAGDLDCYFADPGMAKTLLGWQPRHDIDRMCLDSWRWQQNQLSGLSN